jgi:hypothetical protein
MSSKENYISNIEKARDTHLTQMAKLDLIVSGSSIKDPIPLEKTQCPFGQWLYGEKNLKEILGAQMYEKIEKTHELWHTQYAKIYDIFFKEQNSGFLSKIFKHKPTQMELDKAKAYYGDLKEITDELLSLLLSCERRIRALNDSKFH